jgi:hypothetical protein
MSPHPRCPADGLRSLVRKALPIAALLAAASVADLHGATFLGVLNNVDADGDNLADDLPIFRLTFDVTAGSTVNFDSLVFEHGGLDWNNDGFKTGFDMYFVLYNSSNQCIAANDDYFGAPDFNGSTHGFDSVLNYTFQTAGSYQLSFGQLAFSDAEALQGYQQDYAFYDYEGSDGHQDFAPWQLDANASHGTLSNAVISGGGGAFSAIPEPGGMLSQVPEPGNMLSLALLVGGGAAMRRRLRGPGH